jgi:large subunit ribosomal protein L22
MKRIRPAPQGRAFRYQRRMSHIVISVAERKPLGLVTTAEPESDTAARGKKPAKKKSAKPAAKKTAAKKTAAKKSTKSAKAAK